MTLTTRSAKADEREAREVTDVYIDPLCHPEPAPSDEIPMRSPGSLLSLRMWAHAQTEVQ